MGNMGGLRIAFETPLFGGGRRSQAVISKRAGLRSGDGHLFAGGRGVGENAHTMTAPGTSYFRVERVTEDVEGKRASMDQFERDWDYILIHEGELLESYPEEWVGVQDGRVFHAPSLPGLLDAIRAAGCDPMKTARTFMTRDDTALVL